MQLTTGSFRQLLVFGCLAGAVVSQVNAELTFVEGGYAELCSDAALSAEISERIVLTGSRLGLPPVDVCTLATSMTDPGQATAAGNFNNRGVLLFLKKDFAGALEDFDNAIKLEPEQGAYHVNRGYALTALQRWEESQQAYTTGIELGSPELDKAYFNRGIAHEELGNIRQAYQDYSMAAELNPLWDEPRAELQRFSVRR